MSFNTQEQMNIVNDTYQEKITRMQPALYDFSILSAGWLESEKIQKTCLQRKLEKKTTTAAAKKQSKRSVISCAELFWLSYPKACIPVSTTNRQALKISFDSLPNLKQ